jgi:signal transduction histidine kinase
MAERPVLKRTPIRLAATFTALFAITVIALFGLLFFGLTASLTDRIRERTEETMDTLVSIDRDKGFSELASVLTAEAASVPDIDFVFELVDENGGHVAGNVKGIPRSGDWLSLERSAMQATWDNGEKDDRFLAVWHPVSKGRLLVGSSNRELRQTQTFLLEVLGIGLIATTLAGGLCGTFLAITTQHRIDAFASTLAAVSEGKIASRVPLSGSGDDIDHVAEQVNHTLDHLQRLIENVNQSSSDIAHDLKKPISRLRQRLDMARLTGSTVSDYRAAISDTLGDLDSMTATFDALLRITQIEAGARRARFAVLDLGAVLDDVGDIYAAVAEDAGHRLEGPSARWKPAMIKGDRDLLLQLFANLIENAIRHCPTGARIALFLHDEPDGFRAEVRDNGPGIPAGERKNVFRRLYRLERARSTPGSGLGLTLAAAIAELHDAKIVLKDGEPGLCVSITFPAVPASA